MAQQTRVEITSDLSGDSDAQTTTFAVDGTSYEIDLTESETKEFHDLLAKYSDVARKAGSTGGSRRRSGGSTTPKTSASGVDNGAVRAWAQEQPEWKDQVSQRGRISGKVIDAYKAATGS